MKIGIGSYTYGWASGTYGWELTKEKPHLSAEDLIRRAHSFGLSLVQIVLRPALETMAQEELERIRSLAEGLGVEIEAGTAGSNPEHLRAYINAAKTVGARLVRTIITQPSPGLKEEESLFREILPDLKSRGISIAVENHETSSSQDLRKMIENIADPRLGVCLDSVNSLGRGEGVWEVIDLLLPVTINLHVKDFTVIRGETDMGFTIVGAPTGKGKLNIPRLLERMHQTNPRVNAILEQWTPLSGTIEESIAEQERWAEEGVRYLGKALIDLGQSKVRELA